MLLVVDASVLIDYARADRRLLRLAADHLGRVHVPALILDEVDQLSAQECRGLGIELVDVSEAQLIEAQTPLPRLSFQDTVCFVLARDAGWTCVSNDRQLRRACSGAGVSVLWGMELMLLLVERGQLEASEARRIARLMSQDHPRGIADEVLARFQARLAKTAARRRKKRP